MKGYIIQQTYRIINDKPNVLLFGRLENKQSFLAVIETRPYFYIKSSDSGKAAKISDKFESESAALKDFSGKKVTKIILNNPKEVPDLRKSFEAAGIKCYEADIRFAYRILFDNDIKRSIGLDGDYESSDSVDRIYKNPILKKSDWNPELKILSFDIETNGKASEIYAISLAMGDFNKVLLSSKEKIAGFECFDSEQKLLLAFQNEIIKQDPDIITGWNVIDFDLIVLQKRFKHYGMPFVIGRDNKECRIKLEKGFFRSSTVDIPGRVVLDALNMIQSSFIKLPDYKLETAATKFLGEGKLVEFKGDKRKIIEGMYKNNKKLLAEYCLKDSVLVLEILKKSRVLELAVLRSSLTGMPLDRVSASVASLDSLYLREAHKRGMVLPSGSYQEKPEPIKGGYVMDSVPGIYSYLIVLDFKSLYPSIIRTFNIDPASYVSSCKGKNLVKAPNGACFRNEEGILPQIIEQLWKQRDIAKKNNDELTSYAVKILMNSFFGVLASPSCRFFSMEVANAITHSGQHIIKMTSAKVKEMGYEVIYSDTDSVFIVTNAKSQKEAEEIGDMLQKSINSFYVKHIKDKHNRDSKLELEFKKCYSKFLMPKLRNSEVGAKKRYAGMVAGNDKLEIVGMEAIRGDWTDLAKDFQKELLTAVFNGKDPSRIVIDYVKDLREGKLDKKLVYKKSIRKELKDYTATSPPHVKAARLLDNLESSIIEYVITTNGPEPIQKIKHPIDYQHYLDKQLKPIADAILIFFKLDFNSISGETKQSSLSNFK